MVRYINGKDRPTEINVRSYTGDGSTTGFTVTQGMTVDKVMVTENGVLQKPTDDYTISGTTLTMDTAPAVSVQLIIREMPV
jgi:predicted Zn-dependent protease